MQRKHVIQANALRTLTMETFQARGVPLDVAISLADSLVLSNLKGHDSHGVIRIIDYMQWLDNGWFDPMGELEVVENRVGLLIVDGHFQFGQVIGKQATDLALDKVDEDGFCLLTIRRSGHLGRIGEFMEQAANRGIVCLSLTNTHGGGVMVAPFGGCQPRLSANPLGAGAPTPDGEPIVMDFATGVIAEGKLKLARNKGEAVPPGSIVNNRAEPTTDPNDYFADPPGAILPFAGHKGYALSLFADIFAGAIAGGSCSHAKSDRIANGWFAIFVKPEAFCGRDFYDQQISALRDWIKSCKPMQGFEEVLLPGEPESRTYAERLKHGIPIDETTWQKICEIAGRFRLIVPMS